MSESKLNPYNASKIIILFSINEALASFVVIPAKLIIGAVILNPVQLVYIFRIILSVELIFTMLLSKPSQ